MLGKPLPALLLALAATSAPMLTGCDRVEAEAKPAERLDLRPYEVPKGHRHRLADAIRDVLASGEQRVGHVTVAPNGQLLVSAPADLQPAIAPGTVGSHRNKAFRRLRAALREMGYDYVDDTP